MRNETVSCIYELQKMYQQIEFDFYLSKRKNNVHMGLPMAIFSYSDYVRHWRNLVIKKKNNFYFV